MAYLIRPDVRTGTPSPQRGRRADEGVDPARERKCTIMFAGAGATAGPRFRGSAFPIAGRDALIPPKNHFHMKSSGPAGSTIRRGRRYDVQKQANRWDLRRFPGVVITQADVLHFGVELSQTGVHAVGKDRQAYL